MAPPGGFNSGDHRSGGSIGEGGAGKADESDEGLTEIDLAGLEGKENGVAQGLGADLSGSGVTDDREPRDWGCGRWDGVGKVMADEGVELGSEDNALGGVIDESKGLAEGIESGCV